MFSARMISRSLFTRASGRHRTNEINVISLRLASTFMSRQFTSIDTTVAERNGDYVVRFPVVTEPEPNGAALVMGDGSMLFRQAEIKLEQARDWLHLAFLRQNVFEPDFTFKTMRDYHLNFFAVVTACRIENRPQWVHVLTK
jgi:hypothetical protein